MNIQKIYKPLSNIEITQLKNVRQIFSDCYLVSTLNSLTHTDAGRNILKKNIQKSISTQYPKYKIHYRNVYNKPQDIFVTEKEINNLQLLDKYCNPIMPDICENSNLKAVEISMNKLIKKHPFIKSLICRYPNSLEDFEYNSPRKFMRMFTGKEPISVNEQTISQTLNAKKDEAQDVLKAIAKSNGEHNFIAGTGCVSHSMLENWHCYVVIGVNNANKTITLYNPKKGNLFDMKINVFIKKFKFLTGFFSENLK